MHSSNLKLRNLIRLTDEDWTHIQTLLHKGTPEHREIAKRIEKARTVTARERLYIESADKDTTLGCIEVDPDAIVSEYDGEKKETGAYVQVWTWVRKDDAGIFDVGDDVMFDPEDKQGNEHPELKQEFQAVIKAAHLDTDGSTYYTIVDQEDQAFDVEAKYLTLE